MKKSLLLFAMVLATSMSLLAQSHVWDEAVLINNGDTIAAHYPDNVWFKIIVPEEGQVNLTINSTVGLAFQNSEVFGFKNNDIYSRGIFSYGASSYYQAKNMGVGVYYIKIKRDNYCEVDTGVYTLSYTFKPCPQANDPEPNNDYQHAGWLSSGNSVEGRLAYRTSDDVTDLEDWYKIDVPEEGQIDFSVIGYDDLVFQDCEVYGFRNENIYSRGTFSYGDTSTYQAKNVGIGVYYVKIKRFSGNGGYTLNYTFTPCPQYNDAEPNEDYEHAGWLPSGTSRQGRLGYRASDGVTDTQDWYRFTVTQKGSIELTATGTEDLTFSTCVVYGIRDNGNIYTVGYSSGAYSNTATYQANNIEKGTYYVKITHYSGSAGYHLTYNGPSVTGDVTGDSAVDINDVTGLINILLGGSAQEYYYDDADVNGDGEVDINDVTTLINRLLKGY